MYNRLCNNIREQLDSGSFACEIFVDLQQALDTEDHDSIIQKLNHYSISRMAKDRFSSCLQNRLQHVIVNDFSSNLENTLFGFPRGST